MIESIWIEIRPALSCCHFCIVFKKKVNCPLKVKMKKSELVIEISEKKFCVHFKEFTVDPLTMTGLKVVNEVLNFRIQVQSNFQIKAISADKRGPPDFGKGTHTILCHCFNALIEETAFRRILPLPSTDLNLSDLFCHIRENSHMFDYNSVVPKLSDCFYSDHFIMVNRKLISGCLNRGKFIKCKRCLASVGTLHNNYSNLWLNSLMLPSGGISLLMQLKHFVINAVSDPFLILPHILFESEEMNSYLSIIIMDKNMILSSCGQNLQLINDQVVKLKYTFYADFESEIKLLKKDPFNALHHVQVDKSFFNFAVKYLISCSKNIPTIFNKMDGSSMAYLNLTD